MKAKQILIKRTGRGPGRLKMTNSRKSLALVTALVLLITVPSSAQDLQLLKTIDTGWVATDDVAITGNTLLVGVSTPQASGVLYPSALLGYDVSDPAAPSLIGQVSLEDWVSDIQVTNGLAYLANARMGLSIVDLSSWSLVGNYNQWTGPYSSAYLGVGVKGDYAYVGDHWQGLKTIDVSNPALPQLVPGGTTNLPYFEHGVNVDGQVAYVDTAAGSGGAKFASFDVSTPSAPALLDMIDVPLFPGRHVLSGNHAFLASQEGGLHIVDISDPTDLHSVGSYTGVSFVYDVAIQGSNAFLAGMDQGVAMLDVSNPGSVAPVTTYQTDTTAYFLTTSPDHVYVSRLGGKVDVLAVPEPATLIPPQKKDIDNTGGIFDPKGLGHFDVEFTGQDVVATIRVKLTGDNPVGPGGEDLRPIWESGIEDTWNNQYKAVDGSVKYPITVDVEWVTENEHFTVTVHDNNGGAAYGVNSLNFCTDDPAGWGFANQGLVAAHEAGHWLGMLDEYTPENSGDPARWPLYGSDGATLSDWWGLYDQPNGQPLGDLDNNGTDDWEELQALADQSGLMGRNGVVKERYYEYFAEWLGSEFGRDIVLGQAPTFTLRDPGDIPADGEMPIPEPATLTLLALGGLAVLRRRRKL